MPNTTPLLLLFALIQNAAWAQPAPDPFAPLTVYNGAWTVRAEHPWSGGAPGALDHLVSGCRRFTLYFACEQTVNGKPQALLVYTRALTECSYVVDKILTYASYLFGQLEGLGKSLDEAAPKAKAALEGYPEILVPINRLGSELSALYGTYGNWPGFEVF